MDNFFSTLSVSYEDFVVMAGPEFDAGELGKLKTTAGSQPRTLSSWVKLILSVLGPERSIKAKRLFIQGGSGGLGGVTSLNSGTGALTLVGAGGLSVVRAGQTIVLTQAPSSGGGGATPPFYLSAQGIHAKQVIGPLDLMDLPQSPTRLVLNNGEAYLYGGDLENIDYSVYTRQLPPEWHYKIGDTEYDLPFWPNDRVGGLAERVRDEVANLLTSDNGSVTFTYTDDQSRPGRLSLAATGGGGSDPTLTARVAALEQQILSLDTVPPAVGLASSSSNVTTVSSITLTAAPTDNIAVSKVEFYRATTLLTTRLAAPWTATVPLTSSDNGTASFTARAFDSRTPVPNATVSNQVDVTVNIGASDTTPPTVSLSSSSTNVTMASSITLTATASDNVGISYVDFLRNGSFFATDNTSPYTATVALTSSDNGTLSFVARAYDAAGNATSSSPVAVVVNVAAPVNQPPVAGFTTSSSGLTLSTVNTSSDPDGNPLSYVWDFGDSTATSSATDPTHTYATPGTYTVSLAASDGLLSNTHTASVVITASGGSLIENFENATLQPWLTPNYITFTRELDPGHGYAMRSIPTLSSTSFLIYNITLDVPAKIRVKYKLTADPGFRFRMRENYTGNEIFSITMSTSGYQTAESGTIPAGTYILSCVVTPETASSGTAEAWVDDIELVP